MGEKTEITCDWHAGSVPGLVAGTRLFDRFTLQKLLGRGGMGVVWLARDDRQDAPVALKLVPGAVCEEDGPNRRIPTARLLAHPNIATIHDFVDDGQNAGIAMEYVDGATLSTLRKEKRAQCFAVTEIAPWVTSLCDALAYAHDSIGLIHRDLKPWNLMVNGRNELKIIDFGIASTLCDAKTFVTVGNSRNTLNYVSPQQMRGEAPSPADDIYAIGATLYELLSSQPPFFQGDIPAQVREATPPWVAQRRRELGIAGEAVPVRWEETIAACLAKDPAKRPSTAVDLARRLGLGGSIRLVAAKQEFKMRHLLQALFQARLVGSAAGAAALVAAVVIALRPSQPVSKGGNAADASSGEAIPIFTADGFAVGPIIAPDVPRSASEATTTPVPRLAAGAKTGALQVTTAPSGATFAVYPGGTSDETSRVSPPLQAGTAPGSVGDLPPGRYTVFLRTEGWPPERTEVTVAAGETAPVEFGFAHGSANITSAPDGAEIFHGARSLGHAPLTVDLPPGKLQLTARHPDRPARSQTVTIEKDATVSVAFQLRTETAGHRRKERPESTLNKIGRSVKNFFAPKPTPKPRKS